METAQLQKENDRYDADILLKGKIFNNDYWHLKVYKDKSKTPMIYSEQLGNIQDEKTLNRYVSKLEELIHNWINIAPQYSDFVQREILKAIYQYIKLELCYNEDVQSKLLKKVRGNFYIEVFRNFVKDDINHIKSSTYIEPSLLEYLNQTLKISKNLLDDNLIRTIIMCLDYDLIRKGNKSIIERKLSTIELKDYNETKYYINDRRETYKYHLKEKRLDALKSSLLASLLALTVGAGVFIDVQIPKGLKKLSTKETYKTTIETFTNLGEFNKEEKYAPIYNEQTSSMLRIYSEPYETNDGLFRTVNSYKISNFDINDDLEKYYSIDFSLLEPYYTREVKVEDLNNLSSYIEIERITQDLNDTSSELNEDNYKLKVVLTVIATVLFLLIPGVPETLFLIDRLLEYSSDNDIVKRWEELLCESLTKSQELLEKNGYTLESAIKKCDEIIGTDDFDTLDPKYKKVIEKYKEIRNKHTELEDLLQERELKKLLKRK